MQIKNVWILLIPASVLLLIFYKLSGKFICRKLKKYKFIYARSFAVKKLTLIRTLEEDIPDTVQSRQQTVLL